MSVSPSDPWHKQLVRLIKRCGREGTVADIQKALDGVPPEQRELINPVPEILRQWTGDSPPSPVDAQQQWNEIYTHGATRLPRSILVALLDRFPKSKTDTVDWDALLLGSPARDIVAALLRLKLIRSQDLNRLAGDAASDFYRSAALDELVDRGGLRDAEQILQLCSTTERPKGVYERHRIVATWYASARGTKVDDLMCTTLARSPDIAEQILTRLLDDAAVAARLGAAMTDRCLVPPKERTATAEQLKRVLIQWISICHHELTRPSAPRSLTASLVISGAHHAVLNAEGDSSRSDLMIATRAASESTSLSILRSYDHGDPMPAAVTLSSRSLHSVVTEHLAQLHATTQASADAPDQASRHERHLGQKETLEQVLHALDQPTEQAQLRDLLEAAMYNLGVRPVIAPGSEVTFNYREHESTEPTTLDGDVVVALTTGRRLGDAVDGIVLTRATVQPK